MNELRWNARGSLISSKVNECCRNASNRAHYERSDENIVRESSICAEEPLMSEQRSLYVVDGSEELSGLRSEWSFFGSGIQTLTRHREATPHRNDSNHRKNRRIPRQVKAPQNRAEVTHCPSTSSEFMNILSIITFRIMCRLSYVKWRLAWWHLNTVVFQTDEGLTRSEDRCTESCFLRGCLTLKQGVILIFTLRMCNWRHPSDPERLWGKRTVRLSCGPACRFTPNFLRIQLPTSESRASVYRGRVMDNS